ncbi:MAG: autotransporter-associated beta strand repeat-containing protein, partial [Planctomycetales bacterium]|nr:autotransporter-associated beta strand repeat-containing protein [Planctomycetales bacterium]
MKRTITLLTLATLLAIGLATSRAHAVALEEFDWNELAGGTHNWTDSAPSNWDAPSADPPGNNLYPDDPSHMDPDADPNNPTPPMTIDPVVGANLSVALTGDLTVQLPTDVTVAELQIGVAGRTTTLSSTGGRLLMKHDEINLSTQIDDPNSDDPQDMVDEFTLAYNAGRAVVFSNGGGAATNVISAVIGSTETFELAGDNTLTLSGGIQEVEVDVVDDTRANRTIVRSHIGTYNPALSIDSQPRVIVSGVTTTVVDNLLNADDNPEDVPLFLNAGGNFQPEYLSAANTEMGMGHPHGILDMVGGITGPGRVEIGTIQRGNNDNPVVPLATVVLYDNSYGGSTIVDRANVVLRHNNAFSTGTVTIGNPANELGFVLNAQPNSSETTADERVLANAFHLPHDWTVKGSMSLKITGATDAPNSGAWVNLLPEGKQLTLTNQIWTSDNQENRYGFDGSGKTVLFGPIIDWDAVAEPIVPADTSTRIEKHGTGALYIQSSLGPDGEENTGDEHDNSTTWTDLISPFNPADAATIIIGGGNLHFREVSDMGAANVEVESASGAIGVDSGTVAAMASIASRFTNSASYVGQFEGSGFGATLEQDVNRFGAWDHGGLMLTTAADAAANLDFTSGDLVSVQDMSVAAPEGGMTYTGTITPAALEYRTGNITSGTATYRLGGGSGTLTIPTGKLTGARALLVTNGGDYDNPNGEDRVRLGMVKLQGTNTYTGVTTITGQYVNTLQDGAIADDADLAELRQYNGTTLAVDQMGAIGSGAITVQGSTLRYEGAGESTSRLFTVGTHGAALDSSGAGAINFTSTSALPMDVAEARGANIATAFSSGANQLVGFFNTDDLVIGMSLSYPHSDGVSAPFETTITDIISPTRIQIADAITNSAAIAVRTVTFTDVERTLRLTGSNAGNNILSPAIGDSTNSGVVNVEKSGSGKWILNGANTYTGDTNVLEGTLGVKNGVGTLAAGTNLLLEAGAALEFEISGAATNDLLTITGEAMLAGMIDVALLGGFNPTSGSFDILTAGSIVDNGLSIVGDGSFSYEIVGGTTLRLNVAGAPGLPGDFNGDDVVNAADYTVW